MHYYKNILQITKNNFICFCFLLLQQILTKSLDLLYRQKRTIDDRELLSVSISTAFWGSLSLASTVMSGFFFVLRLDSNLL